MNPGALRMKFIFATIKPYTLSDREIFGLLLDDGVRLRADDRGESTM